MADCQLYVLGLPVIFDCPAIYFIIVASRFCNCVSQYVMCVETCQIYYRSAKSKAKSLRTAAKQTYNRAGTQARMHGGAQARMLPRTRPRRHASTHARRHATTQARRRARRQSFSCHQTTTCSSRTVDSDVRVFMSQRHHISTPCGADWLPGSNEITIFF